MLNLRALVVKLMSPKTKSLGLIKSNKHLLSLLLVAQRGRHQKPSRAGKEIDMKCDQNGREQTGVGSLRVRDRPK